MRKTSSYWFRKMDDDQMYGRVLDPNRGYRVTTEKLAIAGIPERYHECSLDQIPKDVPHREPLYEWARRIPSHLDSGRGLILLGQFGAGKTGSAVSLMIEAMCAGAYCWFVNMMTLSELFKRHDREARIIQRRIEKTQLVLLDDLGAPGASDFGFHKDTVERVVRRRYNARLSTIATSNLTSEEFLKEHESLKSIWASDYDKVTCSGINWRALEGRNEEDE